ncbi:hypothetical protein CRM22_001540 [Opisthorchis felineus]|uniref:Uncharacterized protein n=1 Tax=Opisthorchis felineus TaxID=147828 RepID=A0A4S2MA77_OPIFE|nr:hypothetical protein CRM22_001540 [Opisthorchis felineus]
MRSGLLNCRRVQGINCSWQVVKRSLMMNFITDVIMSLRVLTIFCEIPNSLRLIIGRNVRIGGYSDKTIRSLIDGQQSTAEKNALQLFANNGRNGMNDRFQSQAASSKQLKPRRTRPDDRR